MRSPTDPSSSKTQVRVSNDAPQRHARMTGYVPRHPRLYRVYNLFLAVAIVLFLLPLIAGLALTSRIVQGPGVIARAPRLGLHSRVFDLLTFRTSSQGQDLLMKGDFGRGHAFGVFLVATGLHELPQLFNVIKGDMNLIGPRPVRPAVAKIEAARDPLYNIRFTVKPGMFGHTQSFMCRGVTQRLRDKLTYRKCRMQVNIWVELGLILRVAASMCGRVTGRLWLQDSRRGHLIRARHKAQNWQIMIETDAGVYPVYAFSQGLLTTPHLVTGGMARIIFKTHSGGVRRAAVDLARLSHLQHETVFHYVPAHENAVHLINRYLREDPMVLPRQPRLHAPKPQKQAHDLVPVMSGDAITAPRHG